MKLGDKMIYKGEVDPYAGDSYTQAAAALAGEMGKGVNVELQLQMTEKKLKEDVRGLKKRSAEWFKLARDVISRGGRLVVVFGCDDSRVFEPSGIQNITLSNDSHARETIFMFMPVIGGRAPSTEEISLLINELKENDIPLENVELWMTQHGSHDQVDACLSGGEFKGNTRGALAALWGLLQEKENPKPLFERFYVFFQTLSQEERLGYLPDNWQGLEEETGLPIHLLLVLAGLNPDLMINTFQVGDTLRRTLAQLGYGDLVVREGLYEHHDKILNLVGRSGAATAQEKVEFSQVGEPVSFAGEEAKWPREYGHQDPECIFVSIGDIVPDGYELPYFVGKANNDFNIGAASTSQHELRRALCGELWYPVAHHADCVRDAANGDTHEHAHHSFANTRNIIFLVDNEAAKEEVKKFMQEDEFFNRSIREHVQVGFGAIHIVCRQDESVETVRF